MPLSDHPDQRSGASGQPALEPPARAVCRRCCGTGLVCGSMAPIEPGACCQDYANRLCPRCGGSGMEPAEETGEKP